MKPIEGTINGVCTKIAIVYLAIVSCFVGQVTTTKTDKPSKEYPVEFENKWTLAYATDFSKETSQSEWSVMIGNAIVTEDALVLRADTGYTQIILKKPYFLSPSLRMEVGAYVTEYGKLSEINLFLHSNEAGYQGSYFFQFGTEQGKVNRLLRIGKIVKETVVNKVLPEREHLYRIVAENARGHIRFEVDGTNLYEWDDINPLWGPEHCYIGFYARESVIAIDYVKIFHKVPK